MAAGNELCAVVKRNALALYVSFNIVISFVTPFLKKEGVSGRGVNTEIMVLKRSVRPLRRAASLPSQF
jgi:uncharacterized membrane protein (DUF485 family)